MRLQVSRSLSQSLTSLTLRKYSATLSSASAHRQEDVKAYVKTIRSDISWCKNRGIDLSMIHEVSSLEHSVDVAHKYALALKKAGAVDFDDILLLTERLFRSETEVADKWAGRFDHVLVDEFQDTNPIQMNLVRHLVPSPGT